MSYIPKNVCNVTNLFASTRKLHYFVRSRYDSTGLEFIMQSGNALFQNSARASALGSSMGCRIRKSRNVLILLIHPIVPGRNPGRITATLVCFQTVQKSSTLKWQRSRGLASSFLYLYNVCMTLIHRSHVLYNRLVVSASLCCDFPSNY